MRQDATYQKRGTPKEAINFNCPAALLSRVRAEAKNNKLSVNLAIVKALEAMYGEQRKVS